MEPASTLIKRLGGPSAIAAFLGLHRTRVSKWQAPTDKGGTGGKIPMRHWDGLFQLAGQKGIALTTDDLYRPQVKP